MAWQSPGFLGEGIDKNGQRLHLFSAYIDTRDVKRQDHYLLLILGSSSIYQSFVLNSLQQDEPRGKAYIQESFLNRSP